MDKGQLEQGGAAGCAVQIDVDVDVREVYLLVLLFLSNSPCQKTFKQFLSELLEYGLLPRRYHAWYSRSGEQCGTDSDNSLSLPLSYSTLMERYAHIEKDHLVKLLKQLLLNIAVPRHGKVGDFPPNYADVPPNAADVPTLLGSGSFSLLNVDKSIGTEVKPLPVHQRWPHLQADQVHGLSLREIGGGFRKHHRAPSIRSACYAIAKPSTMVQKMQNFKKLRGHRNAVYCAIFDCSGKYVITGSDDRLVKIWSMETAFCLASCRGHEGDITDLAVSSNNVLVASASNDFIIRVWRLPDGIPISVLRGHTGAVTAIAFSPRPNSPYQLLSSSDDGSCRIWDARHSQNSPRIYLPKPILPITGKSNGPPSGGSSSSFALSSNQILCCAYNANGTVFVTGSSDTYARVWNACISSTDQSDQPIHEMDVLSGHENDVNYVQFSGCAVASRFAMCETLKEENFPKLRNPWFCHNYIVSCSRDGSAIIWSPTSRRSHGQPVQWSKSYQMKVPAPPLPPRPPRGGPRQRILPTPRGVNMIVWSLDNRFVLAAIMDCRICVWNAENSSLVHSLTGHTASSYVLDVHPFNPRIAMSAGYDGRAIIWDIWEGVPIRTYEIGGRFKLVDGKFSPDGTSIVLSDDVGQIYLLNTGQGESLKDAKYDQFFLGDYRPLIHDTAGNALDQETQLPPHRRNLRDPLCDSSMMPYSEPYQTMFQKRRLGMLGVDWSSSSMPFTVGPDISLGQDYQMPPLEDWDRIIEPVPQFMDAIYWEPENEVLRDDTDSEYNAAEEFTSEDEQGSLSYSSSSHLSSGAEDSDVEHRQRDGIRRSRRKLKTEKRVKKRNLDDCDGPSESNRGKKLRSGRKISKRKVSKTRSFRPQRISARNAQSMFSKAIELSSDGDDEDVSEDDTSSSGSGQQDSDMHGCKLDRNLQNEQERYTKDEKMVVEANDTLKPPEQSMMKDSKKFVLKISLNGPKKPVSLEGSKLNGESQGSSMKTSKVLLQGTEISMSSKDPGSSSTDVPNVKPLQNHNKIHVVGTEQSEEKKIDVAVCSNSGESTPVDAFVDLCASFDSQKESKVDVAWDATRFISNALQDQDGPTSDDISPPDRIHKYLLVSSSPQMHLESEHDAVAGSCSPAFDKEDRDCRQLDLGHSHDLTSKLAEANHSQDLKGNAQPVLPRLKIKTKNVLMDSKIPEVKFMHAVDNSTTNRGLGMSLNYLNHCQGDEAHKVVNDVEFSGAVVAENASNVIGHHDSGVGSSEIVTTLPCRTRSMKAISRELNAVNNNFRLKVVHRSERTSSNAGDHFLSEEGILNSKWSVGLRSARSRQDSYLGNDAKFLKERNSSHPTRKLSWLILSKHEEGYRYIPQLGDEVIYLRQGHQEYVETMGARERGPWTSVKGLKAVEICKIESLEYDTVAGSGDSCCKMKVRFVDPSSSGFGEAFKLTLPELIDFPDFIVEKTRFDAAVGRNWTRRDRCRVWWRNENGEDGSWWDGWIHSVQAKSSEFPDSPWERFVVHYHTNPGEDHRHSPWELLDPDTQWQHPHIDFDIRDKLLFLFDKLEQSVGKHEDRYGVRKFNEAFDKLDFFNRFPVPLCPEVIQTRLENNYYRSLEAVKHDIDVMMKNAQLYFQRNVELLNKMHRLSNWFERKLSKL